MFHRGNVWSPQWTYGIKLDKLQKKMTASALGRAKIATEDPGEFVRARLREASKAIEDKGRWWSKIWYQQALKWDAHLGRDAMRQSDFFDGRVDLADVQTQFSWAPLLSRWHGAEWLASQRQFVFRGQGGVESKTNTRKIRGHPAIRWHEGISFAMRMLQ